MEDGQVFEKSTIYLHIGYPKTGTTYIQNYLKGIDSNKINYIGQFEIWDILHKICYQNEFSYDKFEILDELRPHLSSDTNIISFESLVGSVFYKSINAKIVADRLKELFPNAKIIISIRNQKEWLYSLYKQYIHEGGTKSLFDFCNFNSTWHLDDQKFNVKEISYLNLIEYYIGIFGNENVKILLFEEFITNKKSFILRLNRFLNIEVGEKNLPNATSNKGYGKYQIFIARIVNRILYSHFNRNSFHISFFRLYPFQSKLDTKILRRILQSKLSFYLLGNKKINDARIDKKVTALFRKENNLLEKFIDKDKVELFRKKYAYDEER